MKKHICTIALLLCIVALLAQKPIAFIVGKNLYDLDGKVVLSLKDSQHFLGNKKQKQLTFPPFAVSSLNDIEKINFDAPAFTIFDEKTKEIFIIDPFGKVTANLGIKFYAVGPFYEGKAIAYRKMNERDAYMLSYIDKNGNILFNGKEYWEASPFSEGMAAVQFDDEKGEIGFINEKGEFVINLKDKYRAKGFNIPRFGELYHFKNGLYLQKIPRKVKFRSRIAKFDSYFLDKEGNEVRHIEKEIGHLIPKEVEKDEPLPEMPNRTLIAGDINMMDMPMYQGDPKNGYFLNRLENGNLELRTFDNSVNKDYIIDDLTLKATESKKGAGRFENGLYVNQIQLPSDDKYNIIHEISDIEGNLLYKAESETNGAERWKPNPTKRHIWAYPLSPNYILLHAYNTKVYGFDTLIVYDVKQKKEIFADLGTIHQVLSHDLVEFSYRLYTPTKGKAKNDYFDAYAELKKIYRFDGKKVYETPLKELQYTFKSQTEDADYQQIDKTSVRKATFKEKAISKIYGFNHLEDLTLVFKETTPISEDFGKLTTLKHLTISNETKFQKQLLPESFKKLQNLETLTLIDGRYTNLNELVKKMPKLHTISFVMSNDLSKRPNYKADIEKLRKKNKKKNIIFKVEKDEMYYNPMFFPNKKEDTSED